jgi:uncharacterized membrane protein
MRAGGAGHTERSQRRRTRLWVWPVVAGAAALVVAVVLLRVQLPGGWARLAWPGDSASASAMVQTVASSVITVTTVLFTLTVVALQLASQQFSPRLLREFTRDRVTRAVLSVLVATFVLAVTVLRGLRADTPVPALAVLAVLVAGLASLAAILAFITHIVRVLRVDTMMLAVHDETSRAIATFYPSYEDDAPVSPAQWRPPDGDGQVVAAARSGFVRFVDVAVLVDRAAEHDVVVEVVVRPGDHVVRGTPLAVARQRAGGPPHAPELVEQVVQAAVVVDYERTLEQDAAHGFRQLEDIAVKALSPGVNDPVTAAHAIGHMADLLTRLTQCRLGPTVHLDADGVGRAVVPDRDLRYYLDLACGQVRRFAQREPTVLVALLRMLRDVAVSSRDDWQRAELLEQGRLVVEAMDDTLLPEERRSVEDMEARLRDVVCGNVVPAYSDRSGEMRSI